MRSPDEQDIDEAVPLYEHNAPSTRLPERPRLLGFVATSVALAGSIGAVALRAHLGDPTSEPRRRTSLSHERTLLRTADDEEHTVWNHSLGQYVWFSSQSEEDADARQAQLDEEQPTFATVELLSWTQAKAKANGAVDKLSAEQKALLLHGSDASGGISRYVGELQGQGKLPTLHMQDGPSGFRPTGLDEQGTSTEFPSMLALAATWDTVMVESVGRAVGREFRGKGANVLLGPSLNVVRYAAGGRNFDFLPGEDPYLGARLAPAYIRGVQSQGVIAVAKGFGFAEQETSGDNLNVQVNERTAWEVYYPPFEAAVNAGVSGVMCAGNKVNRDHACESKALLKHDLLDTMGFEGFVMSGWQDTHSTEAVEAGLHLEMPTAQWFSSTRLLADKGRLGAVDEAAKRVVSAMYHVRLDEQHKCTAPCKAERASDQRSENPEHYGSLAVDAALKSIVLLQNDGVLPLDSQQMSTVAVLGWAANETEAQNFMRGSPYGGGGSSHVVSPHAISPLSAIISRGWTTGIEVVHYVGFNVTEAKRVAAKADVALVFTAALAREGADRRSLDLGWGADHLVESVAELRPTVVLMQAPGPVLTPWRKKASAIAAMFLGGEQTGKAWADMIFGSAAPSGRLPVTLPASESDVLHPEESLVATYREGLSSLYRKSQLKAAFHFGHGLSYTMFVHERPKLVAGTGCAKVLCISVTVRNSGGRAGEDVVQAYIAFGSGNDKASTQLRGFKRTGKILAGQHKEVVLAFSSRDLSVYKSGAGFVQESKFEVHLGASSADIRHVVSVKPGGAITLLSEDGKALDPPVKLTSSVEEGARPTTTVKATTSSTRATRSTTEASHRSSATISTSSVATVRSSPGSRDSTSGTTDKEQPSDGEQAPWGVARFADAVAGFFGSLR